MLTPCMYNTVYGRYMADMPPPPPCRHPLPNTPRTYATPPRVYAYMYTYTHMHMHMYMFTCSHVHMPPAKILCGEHLLAVSLARVALPCWLQDATERKALLGTATVRIWLLGVGVGVGVAVRGVMGKGCHAVSLRRRFRVGLGLGLGYSHST